MSLHQLKEEIVKHAEEEARKITEEAHKKETEILSVKKEALRKKEDEKAEMIEKELNALERREIAAMTVETRKYLYEKKTEIMENIFKKAEEELHKLSKKEKTAIINALLRKASKEIEISTIYCNSSDKGFVRTSTEIIADENITAGIIVENKDKTIRIDYSLENTMQQLREQKLQEIAYTLFE